MASSRLLTSFTCNKEGSGEEFHSGTTPVAARHLPNGLVDQTALPHFAGCLPQLYRHATARWRNSRNASLLARVPNRQHRWVSAPRVPSAVETRLVSFAT